MYISASDVSKGTQILSMIKFTCMNEWFTTLKNIEIVKFRA
jgi:hypothetical protein